jgi:type 2 lantibiotic biosynthesis protein LanM
MDRRLPWHRAASLPERLATGVPAAIDDEYAEKRLAMWTELAPLAGDRDTIDERLVPLDVTGAQLTALLGESEDSLAGRFAAEPAWHRTFRRWWSAGIAVPAADRRVGPHLGLLEVARHLVEGAVCELDGEIRERLAQRDGAETDPVLADADRVAEVLCATVPMADLLNYMNRTLVLELNVARVEQRLTGESPEERFQSFVDTLATEDGALAIWSEYPVLARLIVTTLTFWLRTRVELLDALIADLPALRVGVLAAQLPSRLERVEFGAGDKHRRGRSVALVVFDTGNVMFKPRSLAMDAAFDGLLDWLNAQGLTHPLRRVRVLDRSGHGWVEYVDATERTDAAGGDRYAWRLGALTAVLYLLHATDFHFENILACGEHPVLVDLEALLHTDKSAAVARVDGGRDIASMTLLNSVQSVGVLPNHFLVSGDDGTFGLDVSALSGRGGQLTPMPVPIFDDSGTDVMRLVTRRLTLDAERNLPLAADGEPLDLVSREDDFVDGFADAYRRLRDGRTSLLAPTGPLAPFRRTRSRLIVRPTHIYGRLLLESTHPDFLRDALDRDRSLARLCTGHDEIDCRVEMIRDEMAELRMGDIPMFTIDAQSGNIHAALDDRVIGSCAPAPHDMVAERARTLSDADLRFQEWVIRSSLAATTMGSTNAQWPNWRRTREAAGACEDRFADEARRVAARLREMALSDGKTVGWIGLGLIEETFWQLAPAPTDSYIGITGIAHALDTVATVTGDEASHELAGTVFDQVTRRAHLIGDAFRDVAPKPGRMDIGIGAFSAVGGLVYVLAHAAVRRSRPDYAEAAARLLPGIVRLIDDDDVLDVVSGSAGAVLALLSLEAAAPGTGALDVARRAADRLLEVATEIGDGWGWATPINPDQPLAGLSHGASGMALAFARLNEVSPRADYVEAVRRAIRYEASMWDGALRNWPDLRPANLGGRTVMNSWCHGAPGIALVRHELLRLGTVPELAEALEVDRHRGVLGAISTGLDLDPVSGLGNHSLCHGDVGNLLIVEKAHRPDREPEVAALLPTTWHTLLVEARANGWLCGVPHGVETPGLMTGLAGIAWGLARHAAPDTVPDLLTLEPPR